MSHEEANTYSLFLLKLKCQCSRSFLSGMAAGMVMMLQRILARLQRAIFTEDSDLEGLSKVIMRLTLADPCFEKFASLRHNT
jgi:hypothetical protein